MITPMYIPTSNSAPSKSPAEKANTEAIKRYDDSPRREAFCAGARWERGEDDAPFPFNVWQILIGLWLIINMFLFLIPGMAEGCRSNILAPCGTVTKWTYVFPGIRAGQYFMDWMSQ